VIEFGYVYGVGLVLTTLSALEDNLSSKWSFRVNWAYGCDWLGVRHFEY